MRPIVVSRTESKLKAAIDLGAEAFIATTKWPAPSNESEDGLVKEIIRVADAPFHRSGPGGVNVILQTAPEEEILRRTTGALAMASTMEKVHMYKP